jgi:hypothetical protein
MNERIKQLAEQAGMNIVDDKFSTYGKFAEKFAELIVRECADIAQQHNKSPVAAPLAIGYVIREHFGVEE